MTSTISHAQPTIAARRLPLPAAYLLGTLLGAGLFLLLYWVVVP